MYLLHTTGELCLSPIGLSAMTKLAPRALVGTVMGAWFLASSYSHHFGGAIAKLTAIPRVAGEGVDALSSLPIYSSVFARLGWAAVAIGIAVALIAPLLKRPMHGVT
jgi:POT family proton-dependent oligopeptide transporter